MVKPTNLPHATHLTRHLRLRQLQLVRMAASGANFRDMAEALHVSQPAITKMAQELERVLGAAVFERGPSGIRLSAFGRSVLAHAQRALAALDQMEEDLPRLREGAAPALRIGSPSFTAAVLLARPVAQCLQQTPGLRVLLSEGVSAQLLGALLAGELDCVVGSIDEASISDADLSQLRFEPLYDDQVTFVTHAATPRGADLRRLPQLVDLPWVMPPRTSQVWMAVRHEFAAGGHTLPRGVVEASSVPGLGAILCEAPGTVGAVRADVARYLVHHFGLRPLRIRPAIALPQVGIIRLRSALRAPALEALLALVRAEVRQIFRVRRAKRPSTRPA